MAAKARSYTITNSRKINISPKPKETDLFNLFGDLMSSHWAYYNLMMARHKELIIWRLDVCSIFLQAIYEVLQTGRRNVYPGLGGDQGQDSPSSTITAFSPSIVFHRKSVS